MEYVDYTLKEFSKIVDMLNPDKNN
jgi:hypothetical protein